MAYKWADKYTESNINKNLTDKKFQNKLIVIARGFGIKIWVLANRLLTVFIYQV